MVNGILDCSKIVISAIHGPATGAVAAAPMLVSVTLPTVSPFFVPAYVNADSTGVWPYTLLALVAVTVPFRLKSRSCGGPTASPAGAGVGAGRPGRPGR